MDGRKRKRRIPGNTPPPGRSADETASLTGEIAMLRTFMRQVEALADEGKSLGELLKMLDVLGKSTSRLAGLLRAQRELCGEKEFGAVFQQALTEVIQELGADEGAGR